MFALFLTFMFSSISLYGWYIIFIEVSSFNSISQEGRMAQHIKVLAAKHDNLHFIPGTHIIERTNNHKLFSNFHTCVWHECAPPKQSEKYANA